MGRHKHLLNLLGAVALFVCLMACISARPLKAQAPKQSDAEKTLISKAQALEARGRPDIAVQVWQQILLSDPNNPLALEGVARDYRLSGNSSASDEALDKLRRINPSDPNIGKIQGLTSNKTRDARLGQAGALAKAGNPEAAMKIYREYYGDHPPDGEMALAYYETLYATPNGKQEALTAMRAAAARNPGDERFIVTLGRMLTYDAKTRGEGIKILHEHADSPDAQNALRQALVWDSANPTSAAELREYLKSHPTDSDLEARLKQNESKLAEMNAGIARTPAEREAFAALNAHHLAEAEGRFMAMLDKDEKDPRAAAGMGFLRMQQNNFGAAISYLVQAEQNGFRDNSVVEALSASRFYYTLNEASTAMDANQTDVAAEKYKAALEMRPRSPEALNGLAGVYTRNQQYEEATAIYQQLLKAQPGSADAWRGLFLSYARGHQNAQALALINRFPANVKTSLSRDPEYLQTLATLYQAMGRDADATRTLAQALALPFPDNGANLKTGTRLQYAGILMQAKRYDQAAELYQQVLNDDTTSLPAWMGLVTADHQLQHDKEAIELVEKMPPDTYEAALADAGFLQMLGSIYQQSNQFEIAQGLLERAAKMQAQAGGQPSLNLQVQLASIYLLRNNTEPAYTLYRQILQAHPDNLDAWRGLIGTLQVTNRNMEALQEIKLIPTATRQKLEADIQFEQSEASLYATAGDTVNALALFNKVQKHYAALNQPLPADIAIQSAYVLYNTRNDRALYPVLMNLGAREDLTNQQRETIQGLWANWSVRRAGTAFDSGNSARAIDILDAAAQAFPDNLMVRKAVAGGYLRVGKSKEALSIFKQVDMQDASATDFQGAIGASLAANDKAQAEEWLRQALDRYPRDSAILALAARFEQARGDNGRAADYWRASLAAMPEVSPADKLAHTLVTPDQNLTGSRPATPADLAHLLNPDAEPVGKSPRNKLPPLPAYGHDPYDPSAPIVLPPKSSLPPQNQVNPVANPTYMPVYPVPTTTNIPLPSSELNLPVPGDPNLSPSTNQAAAPSTAARRKRSSAANGNTATASNGSTDYSGRMHLPAAGESVTSTDPGTQSQPSTSTPDSFTPPQPAAPQPATPQPYTPPQGMAATVPPSQPRRTQSAYPQIIPQNAPLPPLPQRNKQALNQPGTQASARPLPAPFTQSNSPATSLGMRISSVPMTPEAARAQALLIDQTDAQLTQGFTIRYLPNASTTNVEVTAQTPTAAAAGPPSPPGYPSSGSTAPPYNPPTRSTYTEAQYTPSAQDAAAGAYSAQKPINTPPPPPDLQSAPPQTQTQTAQPATQAAQAPALTGAHKKLRKAKTTAGQSVPTLVTAPPQQTIPEQPVTESPLPGSQDQTTQGLSDKELQERNLPPLRGPWVRNAHTQPAALNPRDEAEMQLRTIEGGYSAWLGGTGVIAHRSGTPGYDALTSLESAFEASVPLGTKARLTFIARPVFLDSGQANGNAVITLTSGIGPEPFGTESGAVATTTATLPPQQNASGVAGEAQLTFGNLALAGGYTPYGFLVANFTGRAQWRPNRGPLTFSFSRDSVKDTQLSYSGLRDPGSATAFFPGNIWGGVIANSGNVQFAKGDLSSGFYFGVGGQYITGYHVLENKRYDGSMGAYFRVLALPEYGNLNIGANFFAMHYSSNIQAFTYGMGGYFSPQAYFLANVPITWTGHYLTRWHYNILGSFGVQAFSENSEPLYPLDQAIEISQSNPSLPNFTSVGPNYDVRGQVAYAISDHWFVGGFAGANNSRNYTNVNAGFSVRYLFRSQPSTVAGPTGLFQTDDQHALRPLTVP